MITVRNEPQVSLETLKVVPSRYNVYATREDGTLVILNTLSGSRAHIPADYHEEVLDWLSATSPFTLDRDNHLLRELFDAKFLIPETIDELRRTRFLQSQTSSRTDELHLIIMPTEQCNFRCLYLLLRRFT
jgi:uncharacterized protein